MSDDALSDILECHWGDMRLFGIGDIDGAGLTRGWSSAEESHVWNDGPEVTLRLALPAPARPAVLQIEGSAFIRPGQPLQEVTFFVNGFRLGFWRMTTTDLVSLAVRIEPEQMFARADLLLLDCTFHIPLSIRPMDLGEGTDRRELGFCFQTLSVE
jgi:hypothetical protein